MSYEKIGLRLLEYAVLAPSIYNSQPWKFSLNASSGAVEIYPDEGRSRPLELDPRQRDLYLALGACLENLVLAGPALGYDGQEKLFPQGPPENRLVPAARLELRPVSEVMPEPLFSTLLIRHSHAGAYKPASVAEIHLQRLRALPAFSGQEKLYFMTEDSQRQELSLLLHDLSHEGCLKAAMVMEAARWITPKTGGLEGLPMAHIGLPPSVKVRFAFLRYLAFGKELREVARQALLRQGHGIEAPAFLLMTTGNPGPVGYLNAGRWAQRILLTLNEMELAFQILHLPISLSFCHADLRQRFGAPEGEEPVLLIRFGQPENKKWPPTYRRPVEEVLLT
ncbi:MAG TPA: hypothetical protein VK859_10025 [bacterium]|nr:hypothetical protein [bacterium]